MLNRKIDKFIEQHYANNRSSLLLTGARQTGKTFAVRNYAKHHHLNLIEINFFEDQEAKNIFIGAQTANIFTSELQYDPEIPLLGIYTDKTIMRKDICTPVLTAPLFTVART